MSKLSTLFLKDLILSGVHGQTGRENLDPQRFKLNIAISLNVDKASVSDSIGDTYDYKHAVIVARQVIESERHILIEKIATRIGEEISIDPKIKSVEVTVEKIDASNNCVPGIRITTNRKPLEIDETLLDFDLEKILSEILDKGASSVRLLSESYRKRLLEEAKAYNYVKQPEVVGPAKVREQLSSTYKFKDNSLFFRLKEDFEKTMERKLKSLKAQPFQVPLSFNEMSLQLYPKGSIGITPHLDHKKSINLICIFILTGKAKVATCDDREGNNPKFLDTTPGNVILLRGTGMMNSDFRPFHFVSEVSEERIVFGLRQNVTFSS
jgi:dihydroneopterin aldolase